MKLKNLFLYSLPFLMFILFTSSRYNPSNPPTGKTGAPKESTCQESGCHSGGSFTGIASISGIPDTILPDVTYDVTLTHMSNAVRSGFELTVLDTSAIKAGTLTAGSGSNTISASGRSYLRHSTFRTLSGGSTSWNFKWKAPKTANGNKVTFWYATLAANGTGNEKGDNVITGSRTLFLDVTSTTQETDIANQVKIYPVPAKSVVNISIPLESAKLELYTMHGQLIRTQDLTAKTAVDISDLNSGNYLARILYNNKVVTKKIIVE